MSNTFAYHSPADLAREHYDHEMFAREDYLSEAYGAEARMLDAQAEDDWAYEQELAAQEEAAILGITVEQFKADNIRRAANDALARQCDDCRTRITNFFLPF